MQTVAEYLPLLLQGLRMTLILAVSTLVVGLALGMALALAKMSRHAWLSRPVYAVTNFLRGIPEYLILLGAGAPLPVLAGAIVLGFYLLHLAGLKVGKTFQNWTTVLNKVAAELPGDTIYIFGHAGPKFEVTGSRADLTYHGKYLAALLEYTREQVKAGKTLEQLIAAKDVIKGFEDYGPLIQRSLAPAYDEVTSAK